MQFFIGSDQTEFWRGSLVTHGEEHHEVPLLVMLTLAMAAGFAVAWYFYITNPLVPFGLSQALPRALPVPAQRLVFRRLYDFLFVRPAKRIGRFLWKTGDGTIIDGLGPDGVAARVIDITNRVVKLQSGYIYHYAFVMLVGVALLITYFIFAGEACRNELLWPILSTVTFLPLLGALLIVALRGNDEAASRNARFIALWTTWPTFVLSLLLLWRDFDPTTAQFQFVEQRAWLGPITFHMGVDGISLPFVLLTTLLMPLCILASWQSITARVRNI